MSQPKKLPKWRRRQIWEEKEAARRVKAAKRAEEENAPTLNQRAASLAALGFSSYSQYLASDLWSGIRTRVLDRAVCAVCGRLPGQVHHLRYDAETMTGRDVTGLLPICYRCHRRVEFCHGKKRTFEAARRYGLSLVEKRRRRLEKIRARREETDG